MKWFRYVTYGVMVGAVLLALVPIVQVAGDARGTGTHTTDWVRWHETDGILTAEYVHPGSPAAQAGLRENDRLYMFSYRPFRDQAALREAVAAVPPGERRAYHVARGGRFERVDVPLTTRPAFLYPLSSGLWNFSLWGFAFGAFFHLLGLIVLGPLVGRSRHARFTLLLLVASSLWVFSGLARLLVVQTSGLPTTGTFSRSAFEALAWTAAIGWGAFPALLLHKVVNDAQEALAQTPTPLRFGVYVPPLVLAALATRGPLSAGGALSVGGLHVLAVPLLFYTCCFVSAAAALVLVYLRVAPASAPPGSWGETVGAFLLVSAAGGVGWMALAVPFSAPEMTPATGWLVVTLGLLATAPVALATLTTLRHARPGSLLTRALVYVGGLGAIFFAFVGGYTFILASLGPDVSGAGRNVAVGLFVIALLLVFERLARRLRLYAGSFFATGPARAREALSRFQEQMRTILTHEALAQETAITVGEAFGARSVRLFLPAAAPGASLSARADHDADGATDGTAAGWITGAYHPEPPYLTLRHFERIWPSLRRQGRVWARNPELREGTLPEKRAQLLEERGVELALPIMGEGEPVGLLTMSGKKKRGELYTLADLDLLRFLGGQLALATERLDLIARERALVRAGAEAELAALRAQINPHFLFNALNTIASLIEGRPEEAESTVEHLSAIFRHILQTGSQPFVSFEEELNLVQHYLHIEQVRFGEALSVEVDLPPALAHHDVPAFAVQTLVENAVKHGIARKRGGGRVRLTVQRVRLPGQAPAAEVIVDDTGAGIEALFPPEEDDPPGPVGGDGAAPGDAADHRQDGERARDDGRTPDSDGDASAGRSSPHPSFYGIGLRNVADRLERLYDRTDLLTLSSAPGEGTTVRLLLPPAPDRRDDADGAATGTLPEALRHV